MSYFLWVEDFENSPDVSVSQVFGKILGDRNLSNDKMQLKNNLESLGIYIELNFQDGLAFIKTRRHEIDYVILDIDLMAYDAEVDPINEDVLTLLRQFQDYIKQEDRIKDKALLKQKCAELKKIAGFYLYTELVVEQGFPKSHILFCSNHGGDTLSTQKAFKDAKIALPIIYKKADKEAQKWVKDRYENPYSCLRRGIIEGCRFLENLTPNEVRYKEFFKENEQSVTTEDIKSYLKVLENFLPLREPADKRHVITF